MSITSSIESDTSSLLEEENWRGKGESKQIIKKRPSKYLDPCPEIKSIMKKTRLRSNKTVPLINGSISTPIKIKNKTFIVNNTCAFDTIVSIVCIGFYDYPKYKNYIQNSENELFKFCKTIAIRGALKTEYIKRYELLNCYGLLEVSGKSVCGVQCFDAQCNIQNLLKQFKVTSIIKSSKCNKCPVKNNYIEVLSPNMQTIINDGFTRESLENELNKYFLQNQEVCRMCSKDMKLQYKTEPNIFIEIDLMGYYGQENCTLASLPTNITMNGYE